MIKQNIKKRFHPLRQNSSQHSIIHKVCCVKVERIKRGGKPQKDTPSQSVTKNENVKKLTCEKVRYRHFRQALGTAGLWGLGAREIISADIAVRQSGVACYCCSGGTVRAWRMTKKAHKAEE